MWGKYKLSLISACVLAIFILIILSTREINNSDDALVLVMLPQTGEYAYIGEPVRKGIELAFQDKDKYINNKKIKIIYADTQGDTKIGIDTLKRYLDSQEKPSVIITVLTGLSVASIKYAEKYHVPLFVISIKPEITANNTFVYRVYYDAKKEAILFKKYIPLFKSDKIISIVSNDPQTQSAYNQYIKPDLINEKKLNISRYDFKINNRDFKPLVLSIKNEGAGVVLVPGAYAPDIRAFFKELRRQKIETVIQLFGGIAFLDIATKYSKEAIDGMIFLAPSYLFNNNGQGYTNKIKSLYRKKYNEEIVHEVAYSHDMMLAIMKAIGNAQDKSGENVKIALDNLGKIQGINGIFSFDKTGDAQIDMRPAMYIDGYVIPAKRP